MTDKSVLDAWVAQTFGINPGLLAAAAKSGAPAGGGASSPAPSVSAEAAVKADAASAGPTGLDAPAGFGEEYTLEERLKQAMDYPGREQDEARLKAIRRNSSDASPAPPDKAEWTGPVIVIKKPIMTVHADKREMADMDHAAAQVKTRAIVYVNDAYDMMDKTVQGWVTKTGDKILQKSDPPSSFNLFAGLVAGLVGVIGAAFPEVAVPMALLGGTAGTAGAAPDPVNNEKATATVIMHGLAEQVTNKIAKAKTDAQKKVDAALTNFDKGEGSMSSDPDVLERLAKGGDSDIDWIITEKLGFKLGKDVDPNVFKNIEASLTAAIKKWLKDGKRNSALNHKFGVLPMDMYRREGYEKDEIDEWIKDWDKDHEKDEDL